MQRVEGVVQHYPWGDETFIPALLGLPADGQPWAELWLGTHDNGPARLGDEPLAATTGPLPYLLKVLAAGHPLSLQAHPSAEQARAGHAAGRYPDDQPKPELLVALTDFEALCGFRPVADTLALLDQLAVGELATILRAGGIDLALERLYHGRVALEPIVAACVHESTPEAAWVARLAERYPGDPSVAVALLLNLVRLAPGQAMVLGPGNLHAYLHGAGIELMGASDNVVRGGLTTKPIDIEDLLTVVDTTPLAHPVRPATLRYDLDGTSIFLHRVVGPAEHASTGHELVVTSAGATGYLPRGERLVVPAGVTAYVAGATDPADD